MKIFVEYFAFSLFLCKIFGYNGHFLESSKCKITLPNNQKVDLTPLDKPNDPMSSPDIIGDYKFIYNPCTPISCRKSKTSAICQKSLTREDEFNIGVLKTAVLTYNNSLLIDYNGEDNRFSTVYCVCSKVEIDFKFIKEDPEKTYVFELNSKWCCPRDENDGLSFGSILLILFFSVVTSYFVLGFFTLKFVMKKTGNETIPHYDIWISFGKNIKAGVSFCFSKLKSHPSNYDTL